MNTSARSLPILALLAVAGFGPARSGLAQVSEYVVMAGDQSTFHVIQGGVLLRSWSVAPGTAQYQYPLVVTNTVRTMGANVNELGAEYDLNGNDLGTRYTHLAGPARCWDGTTDGVSHYAIDNGGEVYSFNLDWSNPQRLFDAGSLGSLTYDPTTNSLWVSQFSSMTITNYTLAGVVIGSFSTGHTQNMALALDHADGTLWLHDRTTRGTFEQWSKSGTLLNRIPVSGMSTENALGGEMPFGDIASCTFRNGTGINPPDYRCVTRPVLGTTWTTSYGSTANTVATVMLFGFAPATGPAFWQGEFLVALSPSPVAVPGTGNLSILVPNDPNLLGASAWSQGVRIDSSASGTSFLLLNAQDLRLGM